ALVSGQVPYSGFEMEHFGSAMAPDSEADMTWTISDTGFRMVLSTRIPDIIGRNLTPVIQPLYDDFKVEGADIDHWAIHPGGRAILDRVEAGLSLDASSLDASRSVLRNYGNMSSATILFVLKEILEHGVRDRQ